ncbi:MAG: cation transporter [Bacteroidia bacterium]|nr:cation transporter [Bacteroidia bacterium]
MTHTTLTIGGMTCNHCVMTIRRALAALPGVDILDVTIGTASISFEEVVTPLASIIAAIEAAGYTVLAS